MNGLSRGWAFALIASIAANLFVAGFLLAKVARSDLAPPPPPPPAPVAAEQPPRPLQQQPPRAAQPAPGAIVQAAMRRIIEQNNKMLRPSTQAVRRANEAVAAAIVAEPFDRDRLAAALEELRAATLDSQKAVHAAMVEAIAAMSADERREFADASKRGPATPERVQGK